MCATTFPITHSIHELLLEHEAASPPAPGADSATRLAAIGVRIGGKYFEEYGARMKAWYNDYRQDHWVKVPTGLQLMCMSFAFDY